MGPARRVSGALQVERLDNGDRMLLRHLVIDLGVDLDLGDGRFEGFSVSADGTTVVKVPKGFTTDFSSIPAFARALYRFDSVDLAGCCHDYAYYVGVPRAEADEIWRLVAISGTRHVSEFRGRLGWIALRLGGWLAYRSHARRRRERNAEAGDAAPGQELGWQGLATERTGTSMTPRPSTRLRVGHPGEESAPVTRRRRGRS